jgi:apyrase
MNGLKVKMSLFLLLFTCISAQAHYAMYMDAGSSGTRLYIYQIEQSNLNVPIINEVFSKKVEGGLASFKDNTEGVTQPIKKLLDQACDQLKKNKIDLHEVPINILNTGGMRLLTLSEQANIYQSIRQFILKNYHFSLGKIETISGEEEGLYGWLAINYLQETFQHHLPTIGSLDMGNASTQITFAVEDKEIQKSNHLFKLRINEKDYYILSKSFLGLGLREARNSISKSKNAEVCYPLNFKINESFGKFDLDACDHLYINFFRSYPINTASYYPKNMLFIAYGAFYGPFHFLNVENPVSEKNINAAIKNICYQPWENLEKDYRKKINPDYLPYNCAEASAIKVLLFNAYQLKNHSILIKKEINKHKITWTVGALLYDQLQQTTTKK